MARISVCDFCRRGEFTGTKVKVRGKRWGFLPGMLGVATYKLELCDECYTEMEKYIGDKVINKRDE